jgi:hypothetical protein
MNHTKLVIALTATAFMPFSSQHVAAQVPECEPYVFVAEPIGYPAKERAYGKVGWTIYRLGDKSQEVSVQYKPQGVTATAGKDFVSATGTLTFVPGQGQRLASVDLINDSIAEQPETLQLLLTGVGTQPQVSHSVGIIEDDDGASEYPEQTPFIISIKYPARDATVHLAGDEYNTMPFTINLESGPPGVPVTVTYRTQDVTTTAGLDYYPVTGSATLEIINRKSVLVEVTGRNDNVFEGPEAFKLVVTTPSNVNGIKEFTVVIEDLDDQS